MTIPQLKQVKFALSKQGIKNIDDYISKTDEKILLRMIGENTESSSETVTTSIMADNTASSTADNVEGASDMVGASDDHKPVMIPEENTSPSLSPASLPSVEGEVVDDDLLPVDLGERIDDVILSYCTKFKIDDLSKASAERWQGACLCVGKMIKESGVLRDRKREKKEGGRIYNPNKVASLVEPWRILCTAYDKAPLACDFIAFAGVSSEWFYGGGHGKGQRVTTAGGWLRKKVLAIQEAGLGARLTDGKRNPTGTIFFLKNWHGWRDQREVIHTDGGSASAPVNYPTFGMIEDKNEGSGGSGDEI